MYGLTMKPAAKAKTNQYNDLHISSYRARLLLRLGLYGFEDLNISVFVWRAFKQFVGFVEHFQQPRGVRISSSTSSNGRTCSDTGIVLSPTLSLPIIETGELLKSAHWENHE